MREISGGITAVPGFLAAGISAGIKKNGDKDLALIYSSEPALAAGVFTSNRFAAAPVLVSREHLGADLHRAVVINSGCANACTGEKGIKDAEKMALLTAKALNLKNSREVMVASTGVIGEYLPMPKIEVGIYQAVTCLSEEGAGKAAEAIMTTDTKAKEFACCLEIEGKTVTLGGMAKGSGMIHPNMATMLAFITTNLKIEDFLLQEALQAAVDISFNMITVDGDTSTNDTVIIMANGKADNPLIKTKNEAYFIFLKSLIALCTELAKMIVRDGEGATKFIEVKVIKSPDFHTGKLLGRSILNSSLVKTAFFGEDANWGRIITAMGNSGVEFLPEKVDIYLGDMQVAASGRGVLFDEEKVKKILIKEEIILTVNLNSGEQQVITWGCDLSHEYITINGSYRS